MPEAIPDLYQPGEGIAWIEADAEDGTLTIELEGQESRYILTAALWAVLKENPTPPAPEAKPPPATEPREIRQEDLALFRAVELSRCERWIELSRDPEQEIIQIPVALILRLFHYAGLQEPGEAENEGVCRLTAEEMETWLRHPLNALAAIPGGRETLAFLAEFGEEKP